MTPTHVEIKNLDTNQVSYISIDSFNQMQGLFNPNSIYKYVCISRNGDVIVCD